MGHLHFVALLGSLGPASHHRSIANTLDELAPDDVAVSILDSIGGLPHYSVNAEHLGIPAAVTAMARAIYEADAVIVVAPEYNYSIPGVLKNAIDWLGRVSPQPFAGKPVALQTATSNESGGAVAQSHLREVMAALDALILNRPKIVISKVWGKVDLETGVLRDQHARSLITEQLKALEAMVLLTKR